MSDTIFSKIIRGELEADILYSDDDCIAFRDINPQAPIHVLIIPRKPIVSVESIEDADAPLIGHLFAVARDLGRSLGVAESGYRLVINHGTDAGQTVSHLHVHLLAGRNMNWPPG